VDISQAQIPIQASSMQGRLFCYAVAMHRRAIKMMKPTGGSERVAALWIVPPHKTGIYKFKFRIYRNYWSYKELGGSYMPSA